MYVAMTRARNHLAVTYPVNVYASRWGADYAIDQVSRFIDSPVRALMSATAAYPPPAPTPDAPSQGSGGPALDLRALLRGRFGGS